MDFIQGKVKAIIYHNDDNSYTIIKIKVTDATEKMGLFAYDDFDYVTVTGYFPQPMRGEEIKFFGEFKEHNRYGMQYVVNNFEKLSDTSIPGLIEYLASDLFKGVGIKTAQNIVTKLGANLIKMVIEDKAVLNGVPKLSDKLIDVIYDGLVENKAAENTLIKLYGYGITPKMAIKIYKFYQNETIAIIESNPYQLIYDIEGIGFERADQIAKKLGFKDDDPLRIKAMIIFLYNLMGINYGHTFLYYDQLLEYLIKALNKTKELVQESTIKEYIDELVDDGFFTIEDNIIKLKTINYAEQNITEKIKELSNYEQEEIDENKVLELIKLYEGIHDIEYTNLQKKSILRALKANIFILTGGPGTGKTTVIKGLVFVYAKYHQIPIEYNNTLFEVKLIAPTGRAAKRMNETTSLHAETIHRFLGYSYDGKFIHNKDNLVDAQVIIVDEASMIDVFLASQLLQAIPKETKLIIVGDEDQLPSVGPGQILKDLIDSDMIDYTRLKTIHRQANDSNIIALAHSINTESIPGDILNVYEDRMFVEEKSIHFQTRLISSINYLINQGYDLYEDIQILIPMYRGSTGIDSVNRLIQKEFNQNTEKAIVHGDREFRIGDKVIQLTNQIEDQIMNGDQGIVIGITSEEILIVDFFGIEVAYKKGDLINLKHAFAMSIHKSQGSEYKVVIMPLFRSYSIMLKRKLIYTGVTRAKQKLILMGDLNAFRYGVERIEAERQSVLKDLIANKILEKAPIITKKTEKYIKDPTIPFETLGENLEEGITPYSFMED
ncbi:ATP-dependent RecD-like DNA helicase [Candidatus Izimaplasma bacterium HR1]|jgi:exodeoxyribonuclease V alpha subunit|uniref:SF1B family DNA helicase RecD2 n=1 Tax=Candidatus Izimoplasma sp. HR1 TaxID=1541959 RepID=UPI0004F8D127|nr:ATP-dependent RecD-like DNA helicase [Candidatus Izimaplasma bacterium HR1]